MSYSPLWALSYTGLELSSGSNLRLGTHAGARLPSFSPCKMSLVLLLDVLEAGEDCFRHFGRQVVCSQPSDESALTGNALRALADMPPHHFKLDLCCGHPSNIADLLSRRTTIGSGYQVSDCDH